MKTKHASAKETPGAQSFSLADVRGVTVLPLDILNTSQLEDLVRQLNQARAWPS